MYPCKNAGMMIIVSLLVTALFAPSAAAQAERLPLSSVMPEDALVTVWSPSPDELIKSINRFTPGPQGDIPLQELGDAMGQIGLPVETLNGPAALVLLAREVNMKNEGPHVVFLWSVDDLEAITMPFGEPDDDGIYAVPAMVTGEDFCATIYHGYLAVAVDDKSALQALEAAGEKLCEPSDEARKLIDGAQAVAHVNPPAWLDAFKKEIAEYRRELAEEMAQGLADPDAMADAPPFLSSLNKEALLKFVLDFYDLLFALLAEIESVDAALGFDPQGLWIRSATKVMEEGLLARYVVPSDGIEKLAPPLPALDRFYVAAWGKLDEKVVETMLADWQKILARGLELFPTEPNKASDILEQIGAMVEESKGMMGGRFALVGNISDDGPGLAEVVEINDPEKLRGTMAKNITLLNGIIADLIPKDGDVSLEMKYIYESEALTIEGLKVDRLKFEIESNDLEAQEQIEQAMLMYGAGGLGYLFAVVDGKFVMAQGEENMKLALRAARGATDVVLLSADPVVRSTVKKIGLDRDVIYLFVPARLMELMIQMMTKMTGQEVNAPMPLPFATPAAYGIKAIEGGIVRCDLVVPQGCVAECMTVFMGMMGVMMGGGPMAP